MRDLIRRTAQRGAAILALTLVWATMAAAGTVTGTVKNGTNGKPAAGVDVILIQLAGAMQPVADTKTDADGNYKIDNPGVGGGQPMLIRAVYRGVMFHQPLPPGSSTANVTVYEPTSDAKAVKVNSRLIVFQTSGSSLLVGEEYGLENQTQPPAAYFDEKGDFNFGIPQGAQLAQVSSWGPAHMPVTQSTIDRGQRKYAIAYAFQPGDNGVRLSYTVPYNSNSAALRLDSPYTVDRVMLVAPPSMQVSSPGFVAAGTEQGFNLYTRDNVAQGTTIQVAVSGSAPLAPDNGQSDDQSQAGQAPAGQGQDPVNGRAAAEVTTLPNRLDSLRWILVVGFAALFSLGLLIVWRKPVMIAPVALAGVPGSGVPLAAATAAKPKPAASPASPTSNQVSQVEQEVEQSLGGLKDKLFRLELRRQAGAISEEQYAQERARTEAILRELVQG